MSARQPARRRPSSGRPATPAARLGAWGERQARLYLERQGYRIAAANYRCPDGEVDLIAESGGGELVFIEVKTRRGRKFGEAEEAITAAKAQRLTAAAGHYLSQRYGESPAQDRIQWRIDLICLQLDQSGKLQSLTHLPNAIEE